MTYRAEKLFADFHKYEAKRIGEFPSPFYIPESATFVGKGSYVLYRSAKYDPLTYAKPDKPIDYIHDLGNGVRIFRLDIDEGTECQVPQYIHSVETLVLLGKCLGFGYLDEDGDEVEATCKSCDLYVIPSGKALLIVEKKQRVLALIWGGKLNVEPRGIVG